MRFLDALLSPRPLPDDAVIAMVTGNSFIAPGVDTGGLPQYLNQVVADSSDRDFCSDPEALADFHDQLARLLTDRLRFVTVGLSEDSKDNLRALKARFRDEVDAGRAEVRAFYRSWHDPAGRYGLNYPTVAAEFGGLEARLTGIGTVDLLQEPPGTIRPNFGIQSGIGGVYMHWASTAYLSRRVRGEALHAGDRIYLNPRSRDAVAVFAEIIDAAEAAGLVVKGKILDRGIEGNEHRDTDVPFSLRGDAIVLTSGSDTDTLLGIVETVAARHSGAFAGRRVSLIPCPIADGVAAGSNPDFEQGSLTQHRLGVLAGAVMETRRRLGLRGLSLTSPENRRTVISVFRDVLRDACLRAGVMPDNIAFDLTALDRHMRGRTAVGVPARGGVVGWNPVALRDRGNGLR